MHVSMDCVILLHFSTVFQSLVGVDNGMLCTMEHRLQLKRATPQAGLESGSLTQYASAELPRLQEESNGIADCVDPDQTAHSLIWVCSVC